MVALIMGGLTADVFGHCNQKSAWRAITAVFNADFGAMADSPPISSDGVNTGGIGLATLQDQHSGTKASNSSHERHLQLNITRYI